MGMLQKAMAGFGKGLAMKGMEDLRAEADMKKADRLAMLREKSQAKQNVWQGGQNDNRIASAEKIAGGKSPGKQQTIQVLNPVTGAMETKVLTGKGEWRNIPQEGGSPITPEQEAAFVQSGLDLAAEYTNWYKLDFQNLKGLRGGESTLAKMITAAQRNNETSNDIRGRIERSIESGNWDWSGESSAEGGEAGGPSSNVTDIVDNITGGASGREFGRVTPAGDTSAPASGTPGGDAWIDRAVSNAAAGDLASPQETRVMNAEADRMDEYNRNVKSAGILTDAGNITAQLSEANRAVKTMLNAGEFPPDDMIRKAIEYAKGKGNKRKIRYLTALLSKQ